MSLQLIAKQMEAKGRNGDSVLVHMTTGEVAGLQKLAETAGGSLSVNPETGLVEASFLKSILPTLVGAGVSMYAGPMAGAAAGAALGGYQARRSGQDVGMGALMGGLGGYGGSQLASGFGAGAKTLTEKQMLRSGLMALAPSLNAPMPQQQQNTQPLLSTNINQSSVPFQNIQAYQGPTPSYRGGAGNVYIPQFRAAQGGTVNMASGGAFEDIRAYEGVMPSYSYVDGNFLRATTQPTTPVRPQGLLSRLASPEVSQPRVVAPVIRPPVPQPMMETGRGDGYAPNPDFVTPEQQAAFYRDNPTMAGITQFAQRYNPFASLQEYFDPGFIERQGVIAAGLSPNQSFNVNGKVSGFNYDGDYDSFSRDRVSPGSSYVGGTDINSAEMGPGISSGSGYVGGTQINDAEMAGIADAGTVTGGFDRDPQRMAEIGNGVTVGGPASAADLKGESIDSPGNDGASEGRSSGGNSGGADGSNAAGGLLGLAKGGMKQGGFVVPADVVSMVGEGNTDAGYRRIMALLPGATPIRGKDGGQSDTVKTNIEGKQPARVAHGEMYIPPEVVKKAGGAKKLYAMMDKVRQQATGSKKQIKPVRLERAMA